MISELASFTPLDPVFIESPYDMFRVLRTESPVHRVDGLGYVVTRHSTATEILRDPDLFSARFGPGVGGDVALTDEMLEEALSRPGLPAFVPTLLTTDGAEHRRYRGLTSPTFRPSHVRRMGEAVQRRADELVDGFIADGRVELVSQFAVRFPLLVVCDLLGIPPEDLHHFDRWMKYGVSALGGLLSDEERADWFSGQLDMLEYLAGHTRLYRDDPRSDLMGDLVDPRIAVDAGEEPLDDAEVVSVALHYLVAGHETTAKLIGNGVWLLVGHPEQLARVQTDNSRWADCVEEVLRFESPVQSMTRTATRPTALCGVDLDEGDHCVIMIGAANRDPEQFDDPETFDVLRPDARNSIAFSHGAHYCLGANLARLEGTVAFRTLFDRLPNLRLDPGANDFTHQPTWVHRGFNRLHLEFDPPGDLP